MISNKKSVLFISPHYDDVCFSCSGLINSLVLSGISVSWATIFSQGLYPATGFALDCQLSKGIDVETDYMDLRRKEDQACARFLGTECPISLGFLEAPHRGYESPAELFGDLLPNDDQLSDEIAQRISVLTEKINPFAVFSPLGIGNHVDHRLVSLAVRQLPAERAFFYYCESPYILRCTEEEFCSATKNLTPTFISVSDKQLVRAEAYGTYKSQLIYQLRDIGTTEALAQKSARQASVLAGTQKPMIELFFSEKEQSSDILHLLGLVAHKKDM